MLGELTITNGRIKTCKDCLAKAICNHALINYNMGYCALCPGTADIKSLLEEAFHQNESFCKDILLFVKYIGIDIDSITRNAIVTDQVVAD